MKMTKKKVKPMKKRPPLGLIPKHLWDEERLEQIEEAIHRYRNAGHPVPFEWEQEKMELEKQYGLNTKQVVVTGSQVSDIKSEPLFED